MAVTVINPAAIATGEVQKIVADVTKFDVAKQQVELTVTELKKYFIIENEEQLSEAMSALKIASTVDKELEKKRIALVAPWNEGVRKINDYKKDLVKDLGTGIDTVKKAVLTYQKSLADKAKQERTRARIVQLEAMGFVLNEMNSMYERAGIGTVSSMEIQNYEPANWDTIINAYHEKITTAARHDLKQLQDSNDFLSAMGLDEDATDVVTKIEATKTVASAKPATVSHSVGQVTVVKGTTKRWTFEITDVDLVPRQYMVVKDSLITDAIRAGERSIPGVHIFQDEGLSIR